MVQSRKYIIPLRREFQKAPKYKRTKRAINALKEFLRKHMKTEDVKIGKYLNDALWARGAKNPPHKVEVEVEVVEDKKKGFYVKAELVGAPKEAKLSTKKKKLAERLKERLTKKVTPEKAAEEKPGEEIEKLAKEEAAADKKEVQAEKKKEAEAEQEALEKEQVLDKKELHAPKEKNVKHDAEKPEVNEKLRKDRIVDRTKKKSDTMKK